MYTQENDKDQTWPKVPTVVIRGLCHGSSESVSSVPRSNTLYLMNIACAAESFWEQSRHWEVENSTRRVDIDKIGYQSYSSFVYECIMLYCHHIHALPFL
jgi:hypothetical protein